MNALVMINYFIYIQMIGEMLKLVHNFAFIIQILGEYLKTNIMKNIHVLPTVKPSRLLMSKRNNLQFLKDNASLNPNNHFEGTNQNLYITSDEEIENCWIINLTNNEIGYVKNNIGIQKNAKKIILTTDQDLIKDGIQAIDDEFLEWFVKNPSCEEVEILRCPIEGLYTIIPKEEPKQETLKNFINIGGVLVLEEGAKWQQERSYSEEEVIELLQKALTHQDDGEIGSLVTAQGEIRPANFFSWLNKFKKK